jgi:alpha-beta hydrolase superfamily lysophospholipase
MPEHELVAATAWGQLCGSLVLPPGRGPWPAALVIAGSGPTDRDGNSFLLDAPCDNLKLLAQALAARGIASLRYDKRGVGASRYPGLSEEALRFEDLVADAVTLGRLLQRDERVASLTLLGHSEGALIASLAAQALAPRALVCIAGAGERASDVIRQQLQQQLPPELLMRSLAVLDLLEDGLTTQDVPEELVLLFRPSVQPYLVSWFRHDPAQVLGQLQLPVLLLQGAQDAQVGVAHAQRLQAAQPNARLAVVPRMDHLLALAGDHAAGTRRVAAEVADWLQALERQVAA